MVALARKIRAAKTCIFCGGGKLTREHLWPQWSAPLFDGARDPTYYDFSTAVDRHTRAMSETKHYTRTGGAHTKRLRVVCGACNSGWMSGLETQVRHILEPLALDRAISLHATDQLVLAKWIAMKVMVAEHNIATLEVTSREARSEFRQSGAIPDGMRIWLWRCGAARWRTRWDRYVFGLYAEDEAPSGGLNAQDVTFGFGHLLINCLQAAKPEHALLTEPSALHSRQLWPVSNSQLEWPPERLTADEADQIAHTTERVLFEAR